MNKEHQADTESEHVEPAAQDGAEARTEDVNGEDVSAEQAATVEADSVEQDGASEDGAEADIPEVSIESLQAELADAREASLRAAAEAQNARRRSEQDVEKARKFALERISNDLLPVVDNLERALEAASEATDASAITEGVELTLRSFSEVLTKNGIEAVNPVGEPFDPQVHQAMTMVPNPDMEPNTVMDVMQKGYTLNGRLLRPAMVVVSKAAEDG